MALKMHPSLAVHVGDWLKTEIVEPAQVSVTSLAEHFGVSRQALSTLLNGNANLSADMAIRFEKAFGIKADTLLRMQTAYAQDRYVPFEKVHKHPFACLELGLEDGIRPGGQSPAIDGDA